MFHFNSGDTVQICCHSAWFTYLTPKGGIIDDQGDSTDDSIGSAIIMFSNGAMLSDILYASTGANFISIFATENRGGSFNAAADAILLN